MIKGTREGNSFKPNLLSEGIRMTMKKELIPALFSAANLAFYNKDNEHCAKEVKGLFGNNPDLEELANLDDEIKLRFVRDTGASGASAEIRKAYSGDLNFPGPSFPLAIKKMHHSKINADHPEDFYELIDREVYALMNLCHGEKVSPTLTRFYGSFYYPKLNEHWLAFEFCCGGDLQFMKRREVNFNHLASIAAGALAGLEVLHKAGYIHADIKPDNLLLAAPGVVKICDFGLTAKVKGVAQPELHALGTTRYMSPELMLRNVLLDKQDDRATNYVYDFGTDIWSLGIVLLEFLVGVTPLFQLRTARESMFCEYIKNMTKNRDHNRGSALKQLLVMRPAYRRQLEKAQILPQNDVVRLIRRCEMLEPFEDQIDSIIDRPHLRSATVDSAKAVPNLNKAGLYRFNLCIDFIAQCLLCDYERRPSATALKKHQFIKANCKELEKILPEIETIKQEYNTYSGKKDFWKRHPAQLSLKPLNELLKVKEEDQRLDMARKRFSSKFTKAL